MKKEKNYDYNLLIPNERWGNPKLTVNCFFHCSSDCMTESRTYPVKDFCKSKSYFFFIKSAAAEEGYDLPNGIKDWSDYRKEYSQHTRCCGRFYRWADKYKDEFMLFKETFVDDDFEVVMENDGSNNNHININAPIQSFIGGDVSEVNINIGVVPNNNNNNNMNDNEGIIKSAKRKIEGTNNSTDKKIKDLSRNQREESQLGKQMMLQFHYEKKKEEVEINQEALIAFIEVGGDFEDQGKFEDFFGEFIRKKKNEKIEEECSICLDSNNHSNILTCDLDVCKSTCHQECLKNWKEEKNLEFVHCLLCMRGKYVNDKLEQK